MGHEPAGKKKWEKPELVVLVRGRPEEGVLATCKTGYIQGGAGPTNARDGCIYPLGQCGNCDASHTS